MPCPSSWLGIHSNLLVVPLKVWRWEIQPVLVHSIHVFGERNDVLGGIGEQVVPAAADN